METTLPRQRLCLRCQQQKPLDEFRANPMGRDGLGSYCQDCENERAREWRRKNSENFKGRATGPKRCSGCKRVLEDSCFNTDKSRSDGRSPACKECYANWQRERVRKNTDSYVPASGLAICSVCKQEKLVSEFTVQKGRKCGHSCLCRACHAQRHLNLKFEVMSHYTGSIPRCQCCGETVHEFLSIDHIDGRSEEHHRGIVGAILYRWLKKNGYPDGYQVLCHNCNQAKGLYGVCPHQRRWQSKTQS